MDGKQAIELLKKHAPNNDAFEKVLAHSKAVMRVAVRIAEKVDGVDMAFIRDASLLHDIGRFRCPPGEGTIHHGVEGGKILRDEGLPEYAKVAERHLGVGITKEDIKKQGLDLPDQDFLPVSKAEKIITYADNLIEGDQERDMEYVISRFNKELGEEYGDRAKKLHDEIEDMKK